jgi:gluconokinase
MGVSGSGKTTVGQALAAHWGRPFFDADDYHPPQNVTKMAAGIPLTDADRGPWLDRLNRLIRDRPDAVLGCSALKRAYRARLAAGLADPGLTIVYLQVARDELERRMRGRDHFMPPALLDSQLATLQPPTPDEAIVLDGAQPLATLLATLDGRR